MPTQFQKKVLVVVGLGFLIPQVGFCIPTNPTEATTAPQFVIATFNYALWVGTVIAAITLVYGGILYLVSRGNPVRLKQARQRVMYAFLGLVVLFSSFLILNTINPQLVVSPVESPATTTSPSGPNITATPTPTTFEYQELPTGTLVEKILAKNIDCYRDGDMSKEMVDCQDRTKVTIGPVNKYDARKGYCYDFDQDDTPGDFKDANPNTDQIDPMTEHDRLDCLVKLRKAIEPRMEKLKELSVELQKLTEKCDCENCKDVGECDPGECVPYHSTCNTEPGKCKCVKKGGGAECKQKGSAECCLGKPRGEGKGKDPCPKKIRKKIDTMREHALKREYKDKELKKMSVDKFQELVGTEEEGPKPGFQGYRRKEPGEDPKDDILVADQLRYLQINFLRPLKKQLANELQSLRTSEGILKQECPYKAVVSRAELLRLDEAGFNTEIIKFCESTNNPIWGQTCSNQDQVNPTKYCKEFNCKDCKTEEEGKLRCDACDLDQLQQGNCTTTELVEREVTTCKCSEYLLNNQDGTSTCTTTDPTCIMCKIENEEPEGEPEKRCVKRDGDPATFYCPNPSAKTVPKPSAMGVPNIRVEPIPENTYPQGLIPIGKDVDRTQLFGKLILNKLKEIDNSIEEAIYAVYDPYQKDSKKVQTWKLHFLPEGCMCHNNPDNIWGILHCSKELQNTSCECCHDHEECSGTGEDRECHDVCDAWRCVCGSCHCVNAPHPCPLKQSGGIYDKVDLIKEQNQLILKAFQRIYNLTYEENLKKDDPRRTELLNLLVDSREKMQECVTGYQRVPAEEITQKRFISCSMALDLIQLERLFVKPGFPIPGYENCYPYNSSELTSNQQEECKKNRSGTQCGNAIRSIGENGGMNNYFCGQAQ